MSVVTMLMIAGWAATFSFVGISALHESGKLNRIRRRLALWLDASLAEETRISAKRLPEGAVSYQ